MADRVPVCCKRRMTRRNGQFVCARCRTFIDPFIPLTAARTGDR